MVATAETLPAHPRAQARPDPRLPTPVRAKESQQALSVPRGSRSPPAPTNPAKSSGPRNLTPEPTGVKDVAINDEERARAQMYRNAQVVPLFGSPKSRSTALCHSLLGQSTVQEWIVA
jgi:hypothetical protein